MKITILDLSFLELKTLESLYFISHGLFSTKTSFKTVRANLRESNKNFLTVFVFPEVRSA